MIWHAAIFVRVRLPGPYYTEDLTRVVISYEIYETSLRRVSSISYELTTSVRFFLSYDPLKRISLPSKGALFQLENALSTRHDKNI